MSNGNEIMRFNQISSIVLIGIAMFFSSCTIKLNTNFDYDEVIMPKEIREDVIQLKEKLLKHHYDLNWEGRQMDIVEALDQIAAIDIPITLDSLESLLSSTVNNIDDGHTRVIHQGKRDIRIETFQATRISTNSIYVRIPNFTEFNELDKAMTKLQEIYNADSGINVIVDLRNNPGGVIDYVNYFLSYFLPSFTPLYDQVDIRKSGGFGLKNYLLKKKEGLDYFRETGKKKLVGNPKLFVLINEKIASASMLSSYHLKNAGAYIIGKPPKGLFNTFGNSYGHRLSNSKIVFTIATARVLLNKKVPSRMDDMLIPDFVPSQHMDLSQIVRYVEAL